VEVRSTVRDAEARIQIEYVEVPHLKLTSRQVQRLWNLSTEACEAALSTLLHKRFLTQAADGTYVRC